MLLVKKLQLNAILPTVGHPGEDIGYDLYSTQEYTIPSGGMCVISTGIAVEFDPPAGGIIKTRSSSAKNRLMVNGGVIDSGYRGEILVAMENLGCASYTIHIGDKIAQLIEQPFLAEDVEEVEELNAALRQEKGFGSTGV